MVGIRCLYMTIRLWNLTCSGFLIEPFYLFIYLLLLFIGRINKILAVPWVYLLDVLCFNYFIVLFYRPI